MDKKTIQKVTGCSPALPMHVKSRLALILVDPIGNIVWIIVGISFGRGAFNEIVSDSTGNTYLAFVDERQCYT